MTLADTLPQKLAEWRPAGTGRHSLSQALGDSGWTAHLAADRVDTVGCLMWELTLTRASAERKELPTLAAWAEAVAAGAKGLLEPLKVVEVDVQRQEALLRSDSATQRGGSLMYYELILHDRDRALVRRFRAPAEQTGRREQVAFALTHEVLVKLIEDIARF
jgi:hypothetical protein